MQKPLSFASHTWTGEILKKEDFSYVLLVKFREIR